GVVRETCQAILDRAASHAQLSSERGDRCSGVIPQQSQELPIGVVHGLLRTKRGLHSSQNASVIEHCAQKCGAIDQSSAFLLACRPPTLAVGAIKGDAMVDYIGVERVQQLVARIGPARFMEALAHEIEADYRRWREFEKSPRHAIHSPVGVIELMPTSDGRLYSFKYVNGHPKNTAEGLLTVTAFGVLADVETGYPLLLSELT